MKLSCKNTWRQFTKVALEKSSDSVRIPVLIGCQQVDISLWRTLSMSSEWTEGSRTIVKPVLKGFDDGRTSTQPVYAFFLIRLLGLQVLYWTKNNTWQVTYLGYFQRLFEWYTKNGFRSQVWLGMFLPWVDRQYGTSANADPKIKLTLRLLTFPEPPKGTRLRFLPSIIARWGWVAGRGIFPTELEASGNRSAVHGTWDLHFPLQLVWGWDTFWWRLTRAVTWIKRLAPIFPRSLVERCLTFGELFHGAVPL